MKIIRLPEGEEAPHNADCISLWRQADGRYIINGTALASCGDVEEAESVAMIGSDPYPDIETAEAAGLAWANAHCAEEVYIATFS